MPRPQSAGSDYEEPSEEALLGQEYKRLKRSYRVLENDYKAYKEDTRRKLDKQKLVNTNILSFVHTKCVGNRKITMLLLLINFTEKEH